MSAVFVTGPLPSSALDGAKEAAARTQLKLAQKQQRFQEQRRLACFRARKAAAQIRTASVPAIKEPTSPSVPSGIINEETHHSANDLQLLANGSDACGSLASSSSSSGLEMPEECELAQRIVTETEQFKAVWGSIAKHVAPHSPPLHPAQANPNHDPNLMP